MLSAYLLQHGVISHCRLELPERRVCLNNDVVLPARLDRVVLDVERVKLELVDDWLDTTVLHQLFDVLRPEVGHADGFQEARVHEFLEGLP